MFEKRHIGREVLGLSHKLKRNFDNKTACTGITRTQSQILRFVDIEGRNRDIHQKDIEKEFDIRKSTVTSAINLLEKNGYIIRETESEDARFKKLVLTKKANQANEETKRIIEREEEKLISALTKEETEMFFEIMDKLSKAISE